MNCEVELLHNYLIVGAMLFGIGLIGFVCRRNMIVMFISVEMMLQGVSLSLTAWGRFHHDFGGQVLVLFIIAVAACEAAIALALITVMFRRGGKLDIMAWQGLREANQPRFLEIPLPEDPSDYPPQWPHLPPAGEQPTISPDVLDHRPTL